MFENIKKYFRPVDPLKKVWDEVEADIVTKTTVVRDEIELIFVERTNKDYSVLAHRLTAPRLKATFVASKLDAIEWRDAGTVPQGETAELFAKLKAGTWPLHRFE
ncbi:MAG: hypothetical protein V4713_03835 [Pseudomonadota bacterium]